MTERDICLRCGERMYIVEFPGGHEFFCNICDEIDHDENEIDECLCRYDEINPYCPYCFC